MQACKKARRNRPGLLLVHHAQAPGQLGHDLVGGDLTVAAGAQPCLEAVDMFGCKVLRASDRRMTVIEVSPEPPNCVDIGFCRRECASRATNLADAPQRKDERSQQSPPSKIGHIDADVFPITKANIESKTRQRGSYLNVGIRRLWEPDPPAGTMVGSGGAHHDAGASRSSAHREAAASMSARLSSRLSR